MIQGQAIKGRAIKGRQECAYSRWAAMLQAARNSGDGQADASSTALNLY